MKSAAKKSYPGELFEHVDAVISDLKLSNPCPIEIELYEDYVTLSIGPRDFVWDRKTKKLSSAGTFLE